MANEKISQLTQVFSVNPPDLFLLTQYNTESPSNYSSTSISFSAFTGSLPSYSGNTTNRVITSSQNIQTTDYIIFCNQPYGTVVATLPDVSAMQGRQLIFVNISGSYEGSFELSGPFYGASSYNLNTVNSSVTILSDGTTWWIISSH